MQVSKLLVLICLAMLAIMFYIATPAIALEHPWEEGESPGVGGGENPGTSTPVPGTDTTETPLYHASTSGTVFWWFNLILGNVTADIASQQISVATAIDNRAASVDQQHYMDRSVK